MGDAIYAYHQPAKVSRTPDASGASYQNMTLSRVSVCTENQMATNARARRMASASTDAARLRGVCGANHPRRREAGRHHARAARHGTFGENEYGNHDQKSHVGGNVLKEGY